MTGQPKKLLDQVRARPAAVWLSVLKLPPENLDLALKNSRAHRHRSNSRLNPAAARKAHQAPQSRQLDETQEEVAAEPGTTGRGLGGQGEGNSNRQHGECWTPAGCHGWAGGTAREEAVSSVNPGAFSTEPRSGRAWRAPLLNHNTARQQCVRFLARTTIHYCRRKAAQVEIAHG